MVNSCNTQAETLSNETDWQHLYGEIQILGNPHTPGIVSCSVQRSRAGGNALIPYTSIRLIHCVSSDLDMSGLLLSLRLPGVICRQVHVSVRQRPPRHEPQLHFQASLPLPSVALLLLSFLCA
jgi:hypothetical protein